MASIPLLTFKECRILIKFDPFHWQDLIDNSPYCLSYNAYDGRLENLVLDQLIIVDIK